MQQHSSYTRFLSGDSWIILSGIEQSIKQKIESIGTPLKEWNIQINYGIKTGFNDAFIISTEQRNGILNDCATEDERIRTAELIRPVIRGRDVQRYSYEWANKWLIATFPSRNYNIDDYPALKDYLLSFDIRRLEQTGATHKNGNESFKARKKTNNKWFETQDSISYWEDFLRPKILWKRIGSILRFSYDEAGVVGLDSTCFATGEYLAYICCVLNSKMGHYLLQNAPKTGTGDLLISVQAVEPIKIPIIDSSRLHEYSNMLHRVLEKETPEIIDIINQMVYAQYGLSYEEIAYINSLNI